MQEKNGIDISRYVHNDSAALENIMAIGRYELEKSTIKMTATQGWKGMQKKRQYYDQCRLTVWDVPEVIFYFRWYSISISIAQSFVEIIFLFSEIVIYCVKEPFSECMVLSLGK